MSLTRRDFVKQSSLAVASLAAVPVGTAARAPLQGDSGTAWKQLCMFALDAAQSAGAEYADARIVRTRRQVLRTNADRVTAVQDMESAGIGIRVLAGGAWGFAASNRLTRPECVRLAQLATEQAKATQGVGAQPVVLAPVEPYPDGEWISPIRTDPFEVSSDEKLGLLLTANAEALRVDRVRFAQSSLECLQIETTFASTAGSVIAQRAYRVHPSMSITAISADGMDFQTRASTDVAPMGLGYEHVEAADLRRRAGEWAEEAVRKLGARSVVPGDYDLILAPSHLALAVHETIGYPTELDRALGYEAGYAGTSFLAPPQAVLGTFRFGPEFMNVQADRTQRGGLATVGWDDEGVPADSWPLVRDGIFVDYQTTREQASTIASQTGNARSHGCASADAWYHMPLQRMPNVSLLPGEYDYVLDDLVSATERGILIKGWGPYGIDQQRYNFQFSGQLCYEIRDGAIAALVRDVAYRGRTPEFWNALDMLGGPRSYELGGTLGDLKGQPAQVHAVSHGCPVARFRGIPVINTA